MTNIKITHCASGMYQDGTILTAEELLEDFYCERGMEFEYYCLCRVPILDAIDYIAEEWNFYYELV